MPTSTCQHVTSNPTITTTELLKISKNARCITCQAPPPNLWLCLVCRFIGCGESADDHSAQHSQNTQHVLTINMTTLRIWCYSCEMEILPDSNIPPCVLIIKDSNSSCNVDEDSDSDFEEDQNGRARGLTGLCNIGNTCYMNAALQALSNCPPLTRYFLDCSAYIYLSPRSHLAKAYHKLISEMWHKKRHNYIIPSNLMTIVKQLHPMFKGHLQHDSQEFLRHLMDTLQEELKEDIVTHEDLILTEQQYKANALHSASNTMPTINSVTSSDSGVGLNTSTKFKPGENDIVMNDDFSDDNYDKKDSGERYMLPDGVGNVDTEANNSQSSSPEHFISSTSDGILSSSFSNTSAQTIKEANSFYMNSNRFSRNEDKRVETCNENGDVDSNPNKKKQVETRSIISDIFDGQILSTVQCMMCERVSYTTETFQDLSLSIPTSDQISLIRASIASSKDAASESMSHNKSWFSWILAFFHSFWGPSVQLQDCLGAFFSRDELKGENMYNCEKCKKLRNGTKYCRVMKLPEILSIHLKRFRHESMFSSKISTYVQFPIERLDMRPYLHKDCRDSTTMYDLVAVICQHGVATGGHYTAYALNCTNQTWYEFDDQMVTEVDVNQVASSEAYILFYRKQDEEMFTIRHKAEQLSRLLNDSSLLKFYISRRWLNKVNTFADPGPISNHDVLCQHGAIQPRCFSTCSQLLVEVSPELWQFLHAKFGGGPVVNHLSQCTICFADEERIKKRQANELECFIKMHKSFLQQTSTLSSGDASSASIVAINMTWFRCWENFVKGKVSRLPGPIDNKPICITKSLNMGAPILRFNSDYGQMSEEIWNFFIDIYGGGPLVYVKPATLQSIL